ncbi:hypothetical protein EOE67_07875 [Rheinheimera riviphila]|uniref:Uncharacterized protein n=1 Tax=Rheinheimera riviphila TaxID=1834037 RepID=A0A437R074_9GAMM|nr:hypothetical protein [Rheinheimera riviphila]RVU40158.1 hypothetical protein EOE67_07875 [Rheinheimera riviphila]
MKQLYLILLLMTLSIPFSSAQQSLVVKQHSATDNIAIMLLQIDQVLAKGQTAKLPVSWVAAEDEWQKLFEDAATPGLNKTYNQLQVSYLVFRQNHDVSMLRQDIAAALEALGYQ